jgi:hypothetical protein
MATIKGPVLVIGATGQQGRAAIGHFNEAGRYRLSFATWNHWPRQSYATQARTSSRAISTSLLRSGQR